VENFIVMRGERDEQTMFFVLTADKIILLDGTETKREIGIMDGRIFVASKSDQAFENANFNYNAVTCTIL
jgi:hypothetical protein